MRLWANGLRCHADAQGSHAPPGLRLGVKLASPSARLPLDGDEALLLPGITRALDPRVDGVRLAQLVAECRGLLGDDLAEFALHQLAHRKPHQNVSCCLCAAPSRGRSRLWRPCSRGSPSSRPSYVSLA